MFTVDGEGQLNRVWQLQRGKGYSSWEHVLETTEYKISSLPAIVNDASGWWSAFSVSIFIFVFVFLIVLLFVCYYLCLLKMPDTTIQCCAVPLQIISVCQTTYKTLFYFILVYSEWLAQITQTTTALVLQFFPLEATGDIIFTFSFLSALARLTTQLPSQGMG